MTELKSTKTTALFRTAQSLALAGFLFTWASPSSTWALLDQSQETLSAIVYESPGTTNWWAQTVTPTYPYLEAVSIYTFSQPGTNFTIEVYGQTVDNGLSLSTLVASSTKKLPTATPDWQTFNFAYEDISAYTNGTGRLLLLVKSDSLGNATSRGLYYGFNAIPGHPGPYTNGIMRWTVDSGATFYNPFAIYGPYEGDMMFRLFTEVPEPGAAALVALGGLLLWRRRKQTA